MSHSTENDTFRQFCGYSVRIDTPEVDSSTVIWTRSAHARASSAVGAEQRIAAWIDTSLRLCVLTLTRPCRCSTRNDRPAGSATVFEKSRLTSSRAKAAVAQQLISKSGIALRIVQPFL